MGKASIYKGNGKAFIEQDYEQYLKTLDFEFERIMVETSYGKTHILAAGPADGKPIFLFQGGNCINPMTLSWFLPLVNNYRIYAPDTIGHPGYSDENRISAKDASFAYWISELLNHFSIPSCAFIGPSYGAGIILRLATFMPDKIECSVLVSPAGIKLGSKATMIKKILVPLAFFHATSSQKHLKKITDAMSEGNMKDLDRKIIGDVFKYVRLEQEMPKLTTQEELTYYNAPTLVIAGKKDLFFPAAKLENPVKKIFSNLTNLNIYDMGHFPSQEDLIKINNDISGFLAEHY